jgi:Fe-S cluster biogenesis protein NfuA
MSPEGLVEGVLTTIRPAMQADGGDVQLVDVQNGVVSVRLKGMCLHCPSSSLTMKHGIERSLRAQLDWVTDVIRVP